MTYPSDKNKLEFEEIVYRTNWDADYIKGGTPDDILGFHIIKRSVEHRRWLIKEVKRIKKFELMYRAAKEDQATILGDMKKKIENLRKEK